MNKHILFVMRSLDNPELFTQAEKKANWKSAAHAAYDACKDYKAYDAAADAAYAAYGAVDVVYTAVYNAVDVADAAYTAYTAYTADAAEYWIGEFFNKTGEDKQTYINEVERLKDGRNNKKRGLKHEL